MKQFLNDIVFSGFIAIMLLGSISSEKEKGFIKVVNFYAIYDWTLNVSKIQDFNSKYKTNFDKNSFQQNIIMGSKGIYYAIINHEDRNWIISNLDTSLISFDKPSNKRNIIDSISKNRYLCGNCINQGYINYQIKKNIDSLVMKYNDIALKNVVKYTNDALNDLTTIDNPIEKWRKELMLDNNLPYTFNEKVSIGIIDGGFNRSEKQFKNVKNKIIGNSTNDFLDHGSHVFGIAYAVNPKANFWTYSVYGKTTEETIANNTKAIDQAILDKVDVLNISMDGTTFNQSEFLSLQKAVKHGIKVVVSAGNHGKELNYNSCNEYPACYKLKIPQLIVVGAVDKTNNPMEFTNFGPIIDYYFNGYEIKSLKAFGSFYYNSGTSMAAPFITGLISLNLARPNISLSSIR